MKIRNIILTMTMIGIFGCSTTVTQSPSIPVVQPQSQVSKSPTNAEICAKMKSLYEIQKNAHEITPVAIKNHPEKKVEFENSLTQIDNIVSTQENGLRDTNINCPKDTLGSPSNPIVIQH